VTDSSFLPSIVRGNGGRVTVTPAGLDRVEHLASEGKSERTISKALSISSSTFRRLVREDPEVDHAFQSGRAAWADELTDLLMGMARKGNVAAAIYLTKARLGWSETGSREARPNVTINLPPAAATLEEFRRRVVVNTSTREESEEGEGGVTGSIDGPGTGGVEP
jgi:hypothetical protein